MHSTAHSRHLLVAIATCLTLGAAGCTQGVGDIDRTQPDLIAKTDFEGQWFIRQSVVDVPPTSLASFEGEMGAMELITWEIQEDYLVGYRAYELVPGSEERAASAGATVNGQPVAAGQGEGRDPEVFKGNPLYAFAIVDHVDRKRSYNPQTGEQTNVIEENNYDRPWYEREWLRVDWSSNNVDSFLNPSIGAMDPFMLGDPIQAASWVPENEGGPDAFMSERTADDQIEYMDFTTRMFVRPSPIACGSYLWENTLGDCTDDEVKMRTSMLKVDPERERDYIPQVYDDRRHGEFGYFRTERPTYDRQRGNTYTGLILLANRHDIWANSRDSNGNPRAPQDRRLRPVNYTLSTNFPAEMVETTQEVVAEWDAVLKRVAATLRQQTVPDLEDELVTDFDRPCLYCLDTNEDGHARNGDLRYNFIYWVNDPQRLGPLGYGPSVAHPETGRIVSSAAYVYGGGIDSLSAVSKDIVDLLNGDISEDDVIGADYIRQAVATSLKAIDPRAAERITSIPMDQLETQLLGQKAVQRLATLREQGLPQARPGFAENQLSRIQGTPLESMALPPEVLDTFDPTHRLAMLPGASQVPDDPANLSVVNWGTPSAISALGELEKLVASQPHCLWLEQFSDPNVIGLAREAKSAGLTGDALYQYLRKQIYKAVMLHEVGHTLGLRHNFAGSADSLNYKDEYWPLRTTTPPSKFTNDGSITPWLKSNCAIEDVNGGATSNAAECEAQRNAKMGEYQYSTIMDYGGRFNSDFHGIGHYDAAAVASGYGDLVEVFDDSVTQQLTDTVRQGIVSANNRFSPILGQGLEDSLGTHYTAFPEALGSADNIARRQWIPRSTFDPASTAGPFKVPYMSCYDEFVDSTETCHRWDVGADAYEITANLLQRYKEYYVFNNFQRDRVGFSGITVMQTVASRYLLPITNMYQHWLFSSFWRPSNTPQGGLAQLAAIEGFNTLWNVMATPSYGSYENQNGEFVLVDEAMDMSDLTIRPGDGRRQFSRFDYDSGYNVFRRVLESGHFYDQLGGLMALTSFDASVVGVGSDVQADVLRYSIPYYLVFEEDLNSLFGSIYRQDWQQYTYRVVDGSIAPRSIFIDPAAPSDGYVRTNMNFSTRILSLLYGMAFFSSNFDLSFVQRAQVALVGSGEDFTVGPGFERIEVHDPFSGRMYAAVQKTGGENGPWVAAQYLSQLLADVTEYEAMAEGDAKTSLGFQIQQVFEELEILRSVYNAFQSTF